MILSFDKFERYEMPQVMLCNPNSRATEVDGKIMITDTVGVLSNPSGMNLKLNFNAPHELSFDYYRHKSADPIKQSFYDSIYEAIQTDRYIYLTDIGYFRISSASDNDEDNIDRKSITCKSCEENELATAEGLYLEEGTYYLHADNNDGLLDLFLPKTAGWTMGYIDSSLLTKPYYVEDTEVDNGYNFLYTTIQDMFECIVEPDIIKRTISVYSRVYYAEHHLTDIHIAKYNLLKHKMVEENDEDKYTALNVQGKDESLEIRAVNPTGKNVIYNFEPRCSWMSTALQQAIEKWQEKCESVEEEYLTLQQGYYAELEKLFNEEQDIEVLKGELKTLEETKDAVIITVGDQQSTALKNVNAQITAKQKEINTATSTYNSHKKTVQTTYETPIAQINADCALDITAIDINGNTIFTVELLNELMTHIKPTEYVDEYMLVTESMTYPERFEKAKELMDRAQSQLVKISSGQKTYSIDTRSFLFNKQFKHFSEQLCAGAIIYVETKNDKMEQLHLTGIDINFDEKSTDFTLGNKYDRSDLKALYDDALGQNSKSFTELKYIASIIEEQQKQLDYQRNWVADLRTLTLDNVLTSEDQAIEINNRGLIGRKRQLDENGEWDFDENGNPYFEDEQVKLINNTLVFTNDNWNTAVTAVGKIAVGYNADGSVKYAYGMNGQVVIGELFLGNNLVLTGTGAGIKIKDSNGNNVFYADDDGNLVLSGTIYANAGKIGGWDIRTASGTPYLGSAWSPEDGGYPYFLCQNGIDAWSNWGILNWFIYCRAKFGVTSNGVLYASGAHIKGHIEADSGIFSGKITSTEGSVGGWVISDSKLYKTATVGNVERTTGLQNPGVGTWAIAVGATSFNDWASAPFRVDHYGNIYATSGQIGGWAINNSYLQYKNSSYWTCLIPGGTTLYCNDGVSRNLTIGVGTPSAMKFGVTLDGQIFASGGTIGGCVIQNGYIATNSGTSSVRLYGNTDSTAWVLQAGPTSAPTFYVTNSGHMKCTSADVTGTINANAGKIGGWTISGNTLMTGNMSLETEVIIDPNYLIAHGDEAYWWDVVMCTQNWTNQWSSESDINVKNTILEYDLKYEILFDALKPCRYKYNHGTSDRFHTGFIAQEVVEAIECADLTTQDFAGVIHLKEPNKNNCEWLLRRDEFVALNTWQIQKLKSRVIDLESTVAELKTQIQILTAG